MIKKERENMTVKTLEQAFADAVVNPENIKANGNIDWNYVDADCYMDMAMANDGITVDSTKYMEQFNALADAYLSQKVSI